MAYLRRLPHGPIEPDDDGWAHFTYPIARSGLRRGWQVAFLRVGDQLRAVVIARRGNRVGRVGSMFEVRAWRPFGSGIRVKELQQTGLTVANALDRDEQLTEPQERDLIVALTERETWLADTVEAWRRQVDPPRVPENVVGQLSLERDCVRMPLGLAGLPPQQVEAHAYEESHRSYLEGLHGGVRPSEDSMIRHDWTNLTGWNPPPGTFFDGRTFTSPSGRNQLTLIYANRERPEHATGADLIYIDKTRNAVVLIQYKRMADRAPDGGTGYRPDEQLRKELDRMRMVRDWFAGQPRAQGTDAFRLHADPCFIKLCDPVIDLDLGTAPVPGMVFPLDLFDEVHKELKGIGPRGGTCITRRNVSRSLSSTYLVDMVKGGWLGTHTAEDGMKALLHYCRQALDEGKSLTMARVRKRRPKLKAATTPGPATPAKQTPLF